MLIEQLNITSYDETNSEWDMGYLVFQVAESDDYAGLCYDLHFPQPDRGGDAEIDFDDLRTIPIILFYAMLGRKVDDSESLIGKFFRVKLPDGVYNG
jgi:hypothetical protein